MVFAPGISPLHRLTPARYLDSHALSSALRDDKTVPSVARQNKVKYQTTRNGKKTYYIYILAYYLYSKQRNQHSRDFSVILAFQPTVILQNEGAYLPNTHFQTGIKRVNGGQE